MLNIIYNVESPFMKKHHYKNYVRIFWILYTLPILFIIIIFILIGKGEMGFMPDFIDLENPQKNIASEVISEDGVLLGKFYIENRTYVDYEDINENMINALIATEDIRFYKHSGVDARGLARVIVRTMLMGEEGAGGGSTITQQLAKNLFPRDSTYYKSLIKRKLNLAKTKFKEWITATKLEKNYTKKEIITMYLNTVEFGHQSFGIKSATKTFFNTTPDSLRIEQSALLVGLLKGPSKYSPRRNPENSIGRRNVVLSQMNKYGYIDKEQFDSLKHIPLQLDYNIQDHNVGLATYFREHIRKVLTAKKPEPDNYYSYSRFKEDSVEWLHNPLFGWCNKNFKPNGEPYNVYKDGLKIYTTINSNMQQYAEEAMAKHLGGYLQDEFYKEKKGNRKGPFYWRVKQSEIDLIMRTSMRNTDRYRSLRRSGHSEDSIIAIFNRPVKMTVFSWKGNIDTIMSPLDSIMYYKYLLRSALMSMDPHTGHVKAYVGGIDFRYIKYDGVTMQKRQAGSVIKPFLYTLAMEENYLPCTEVLNAPISFLIKENNRDTLWTPENAGWADWVGSTVTLKWGLAKSANYVAAWLVKQLNPQAVVDLAHRMGIRGEILPVPSMIYGTSDFSIYEVVSAFSTFANKGFYTEPLIVTRIEDRNGNTLQTFSPRRSEAINEVTAYLLLDMMMETVNSGTAYASGIKTKYKLTNELAGKTGTTQNNSDAWYMGLAPKLVTGVWVGGEERSIHFNSGTHGAGGTGAMPIWCYYMQKIYENGELGVTTDQKFIRPDGFDMKTDCGVVPINKDTYLNFNNP